MAEPKNPEVEAPSMQIPETEVVSTTGEAPAVSAEEIVAEALMRQTAQPTLVPPSEELIAEEEEGIAAWHSNKKVTALWCNHQPPRNAFISVHGLGWKKLSNANDSSFVSMVMMASHAEQTNSNVNIRIEADGMVHEIYVW